MNCEKYKIENLEQDIDKYDKILFFEEDEVLIIFCCLQITIKTQQKILILTQKDFGADTENFIFRKVTKKEAEKISELYFTYEFSDKFLFVSRKKGNYASLFHFVDTGILNIEEVFEALLY